MKKAISVILVCIIAVLSLSGCGAKYRERDFIGKTSEEITAQFGQFDCIVASKNPEGLYINGRCGYTIRESKTANETVYFIYFDANGTAYKCEKGYRPGG